MVSLASFASSSSSLAAGRPAARRPRRSSPNAPSTAAKAALSLLALAALPQALAGDQPRKRYPISTAPEDLDGQTFDFVVAGGGLAGLAIAARLAEYSNFTVAVIEAGESGDAVEDLIDIPGNSYLNGLTKTAYDWAYKTVAQPDAGGTTKDWPRGKVLGGSGAINGMFWCRGDKSEYDAWAQLNPDGDVTWNGDEIFKYINKAENYTAPTDEQIAYSQGGVFDATVHGTEGPIQAGYSAYWYTGYSKWIPAWETLGFASVDGAGGTNRGGSITPSTLNPTNQTRSDSKAGYIDPLPPKDNLVILTGFQVTSLTFNDTSTDNVFADGVNFAASAAGQTYTVKVAKEVILSGGTIGSPQILQLSGIGPAAALTAAGVDQIIDLPVGYNLQDHTSNTMYWTTPAGTETWGTLRDNQTVNDTAMAAYESGDYANSQWTYVNEAIGYVALKDIMTDYATFAQNATDFTEYNVDRMAAKLDLSTAQMKGLTSMYEITNEWMSGDVGQMEILLTELGGTTTVGIQAAAQHPYTRGTVLITSNSAFTAPEINPYYYGHEYDVAITLAAQNWVRTLAAASPMDEYMITETYPGATTTGDSLVTWFKGAVATEYHILGTCSMLPKDSGGVVDTNLIVYGTKNVRVVDSSIMPLQVAAHLMAPTYGIAEKAADLVKQKYWAVVEETPAESSSAAAAESSSKAASSSGAAGANAGNSSAAASQSTLSSGAIGGIVAAGVVAGLAALGFLAFALWRRRKAKAAAVNEKSGWYAQTDNAEDDPWTAPSGAAMAMADRSAAGSPSASAPFLPGATAAGGAAGYQGAYDSPAPGFAQSGHRESYSTLDMAAAEPMGYATPNAGVPDYGNQAPYGQPNAYSQVRH